MTTAQFHGGIFLNQVSFLSDEKSLCQVRLKVASTDIDWSQLRGLFCERMEDKSVERNSDDGGLAYKVPDRSLRIFKDSIRAIYAIIWLRITKIKLLLCWDFWYWYLGLKNELWLRRDRRHWSKNHLGRVSLGCAHRRGDYGCISCWQLNLLILDCKALMGHRELSLLTV